MTIVPFDFMLFPLLIALLSVVAQVQSHSFSGRCEDLTCATKEQLLDVIDRLQQEKDLARSRQLEQPKRSNEFLSVIGVDAVESQADTTCNICSSGPCLNGGTCYADVNYPWSKYYCVCPDNYGGPQCGKKITCNPNPCGSNAQCFVSNHQTNCVCKPGYSGKNPKNGCYAKVKTACATGDPHYLTFDGLHFDYQGTCPYIFSEPCTNLTGGYADYKVVAKNKLFTNTAVSYVSEVEVTMYGQVVHINGDNNHVYINGYRTNVPYYWPSKTLPSVSVRYSGGKFFVSNDQLVVVTYVNGELCIQVPDIPPFQGNSTLCGLSGNLDNNYKNDVTEKNGTVFPVKSNHMPTSATVYEFNLAQDTWITTDFMTLSTTTCVPGHQLSNNTDCNSEAASQACDPIKQALTGAGPFGQCQNLGDDVINTQLDNCVFDVCHGAPVCAVFQNFVSLCQYTLPGTNLGTWRTTAPVNCPMKCDPNAVYSSCASSCPATCADQSASDFCDLGCHDGCQCKDGYVIDNTDLSMVKCIPVEQCGCTDPQGNSHPADQPWLSANCTLYSTCTNGTYVSQLNRCSRDGYCGTDDTGNMACVCDKGFRGDGYNCTDINECVEDPNICNTGKCTNTPGSYYCTCETYYGGNNCEYYHPRRHCADLYKYWQITTSGQYIINPNYPFNGLPAFTNVSVYCDMDATADGQKGGWTLMSHDIHTGMVNKTFDEYKAGFGTSRDSFWLGLELIHGMTNDMSTSLYLSLYRCPHNNLPGKSTYCVYPKFSVGNSTGNYAVTIPQVCQGSEQLYYDGWARWNLNQTGPAFLSFDQDSSLAHCSNTFQRTGWWFDTTNRCGSANLNGVRYSCDSPPDDSSESTYLYWGGETLGDAVLSLRPASFPNYDPHPPTPL